MPVINIIPTLASCWVLLNLLVPALSVQSLIVVKEGWCDVIEVEESFYITNINKEECMKRCLANSKCSGFFWKDKYGPLCQLYYNAKLQIVELDNGKYCGVRDDVAPTLTPTTTVTSDFLIKEGTCELVKGETTYVKKVSKDQCKYLCRIKSSCDGFYWYNNGNEVCRLYANAEIEIIEKKNNKYCAIKQKTSPTKAPTTTEVRRMYMMQGKACVGETRFSTFKINDVWSCRNVCLKLTKCNGANYIKGQSCELYLKKPKMVASTEDSFCGIVKTNVLATDTPSNAPSAVVTLKPTSIVTSKDFTYILHSVCDGFDKERALLIKTYNSFAQCIMQCDQVTKCRSFFWSQYLNHCYIIYYRVKKIKKVYPADKLRVCGKVKKDEDTNAPTISPAPTHKTTAEVFTNKSFSYKFHSICDEPVKWNEAELFKDMADFAECIHKCDDINQCKSFFWNAAQSKCIIMYYRVKNILKVEPSDNMKVCGKVDQKTKSPTVSPRPTPNPTIECTLEAELGHPYTDPDDAPYYGYHADWLEVTKTSDSDGLCSWTTWWNEYLPSWCSYDISDPEWGDSAMLINWDDDYYPEGDLLAKEKVVIKGAADETIEFLVQHYYYDEDYYTYNDSWKDHMMPALLTINNMSNENQGPLHKGTGWSHPVKKNVSTHIQNADGSWSPNPDYQGNFRVTVSCSNSCFCIATYKVL